MEHHRDGFRVKLGADVGPIRPTLAQAQEDLAKVQAAHDVERCALAAPTKSHGTVLAAVVTSCGDSKEA